jgi:hypothetical protein
VDFDRDVLALDEADFLETLTERSHAVLRHVSERFTAKKHYHRHRRLLHARPRAATPPWRRARDELAHSITLSARISNESSTFFEPRLIVSARCESLR